MLAGVKGDRLLRRAPAPERGAKTLRPTAACRPQIAPPFTILGRFGGAGGQARLRDRTLAVARVRMSC